MTDEDEQDAFAGTEPKASGAILGALTKAEREFNDWNAICHAIDDIYSLQGSPFGGVTGNVTDIGWSDTRLDLFWSSFEVMKQAVYARTPVPAVASRFSDNKPLYNTTAELLERTAISCFAEINFNDAMCATRDDVLFAGRGVIWLTYETKDGKQCIDAEHLDRDDFRHEPARYWREVGWVARGAWLTKKDARKRFRKFSGDAYQNAKYTVRRDDNDDSQTTTRKARFWEVWHRADNMVYWVAEGVDVLLDSGKPHLRLKDFFPCPRPAYGTLARRSLVPVPDWERYALHFSKINDLTGRIYLLLDSVRMKGLIPAGGDIGDAVEQLIASDDDQILIPVPGAALMAGGTAGFVQWLPLAELATAIQGLIDARSQLISDFYELSGVSDIMRGATEAEETLGAQQLKSQYGSVRVRGKIDELQRIAADTVRIMAEIVSEHFTKETLLEMSQMDIPSKKDIEKRIKEVEQAAEKELEALEKKALEAIGQAQAQMANDPNADPQAFEQAKGQAQAQFTEAQQQILAKYAPMLAEAEQMVPIEDVMKLLRDDRARGFTFDIASDSTILTDELQEKAGRNEFLTQFTGASQGLMGLMAMGEQGANLAGEMLKFVLAPYRAGRQLDGAINAFIDAAPEMAKAAQAASGQEGMDESLAEANKTLAEAEKMKADAAMASVQARAAQAEADNQRKIAEMQNKMAADAAKAANEMEKLRQTAQQNAVKADEAAAKVDLLRAQVIKTLTDAGIAVKQQNLDEFKSLQDIEFRAADQVRQTEQQATDNQFRERGESRADRGEDRADQQLMNGGGNG